MQVSPDRLGWTYGENLAADLQSRCQFFRNIHTHSWAHTHTHLHKHTWAHITPSYLLSRAPSRPNFLLSDYLRTCSVRASWEFWNLLDFPSSVSAEGRHPGPRLDCARKRPPTEREDGTADKDESGENTASTKLCSKHSPAWIASLPHIFVSVSPASCGDVSCVVWCLCWQLAWKSFPSVTGWVLCETEQYYWEARPTMRPLAVSIFIIPACNCRTNHFFLILYLIYFLHLIPTGLLFVVSDSGRVIIENRCCYQSCFFEWCILKSNKP